jgi:hypothetical protein
MNGKRRRNVLGGVALLARKENWIATEPHS